MPGDEQYEELRRLLIALTERVYTLEQATGLHTRPAPAESKPAALPPTKVPLDREAELESKIGGHWLNRVGILAVLIGVSYFLKYAFDNEWIGPAGGVLIGLTAGLVIVVWSEHVRHSGYPIFSYSLKATGIGVLYLSLWTASQLYHLIPNSLAFIAMMSVTAATVGLALWQDAQVIAAFAVAGAFLTPVALSSGVNNAVGLFTYLFILDVGALFLVHYRAWIRVVIGSYIGTLILYAAWHATFYTTDQFSTALISTSALFAMFALVPFVTRYHPASFQTSLLALLNAAAYFFEVWELFEHTSDAGRAAIAAVALACLYFLMAYALRTRIGVMADIHWTIGAAFLIAAVPIGMNGSWITMAWFVEGAGLIRVGQRRGTTYLRQLGGLALALGTVRLLGMDDFNVTRLFFNERILSFVVAIAALAYVLRILGIQGGERDRKAAAMVLVMINVLALVALTGEITQTWRRQLQDTNAAGLRTLSIVRDFAYSALWMSYGAALMIVGFWKTSSFLRWQALILIGVTTGKVFLYDMSSLERGYRILSFIALGLILLVTSFLYQRSSLTLRGADEHRQDDL
jgi:uncharacterized membrane protein